MAMIFMTLMICVAVILYIVGVRFDSIKEGDDILYYDGDLPVYDKVSHVYDGGIRTKYGRDFDYWNFFRGDFFKMKNKQND